MIELTSSKSRGRLTDGSAAAELFDVLAVEFPDGGFDFLGAVSYDEVLVKRVGMFINIEKFTSSPTFGSVDNGLVLSCESLDSRFRVVITDARRDGGAVFDL